MQLMLRHTPDSMIPNAIRIMPTSLRIARMVTKSIL